MFRKCSNLLKINHKNIKNILFSPNKAVSFDAYEKLPKIHEKTKEQKQILQDCLGLQYHQSVLFSRKNKFLQGIENDRLSQTIKTLTKVGIMKDDIVENPMSLTLQENAIEHNMLYLHEIGFTNISAQLLLQFRSIVKKPISLLKAHGLLPDELNVARRLFSFIHPGMVDRMLILEFTDEDSIVTIHDKVLKHFLVCKLDTSADVIESMFKRYDKFKYKSIQIISELIEMFNIELRFDNSRLLKHGYLLIGNPRQIGETLSTYPMLAGLPTKYVFYKHPKIITVPTKNITEILDHVKNFGISDIALQKCYDVLTLSPDSVLSRLHELNKIPEFKALIKHDRVLRLVVYQNKAKMRLEQLRNLQVQCASLHILCSTGSVFERYAQEGGDRTKGTDIITYLSKNLKLSKEEVRRKLNLNPNWYHVPLFHVQETMKYLLHKNFSRNDFMKMPIILLYPLDRIRKSLEEMSKTPEIAYAQLTTEQEVNLCLYFIEKKFHFSGDGIWLKSTNINKS